MENKTPNSMGETAPSKPKTEPLAELDPAQSAPSQPPVADESVAARNWLDPRWLRALSSHVWRHFRDDRSFEVAGSLSYTSLLALVPLLAVVFQTLNAIDVFEPWSARLQDFIFDNFVPSVGSEVQRYVGGFLDSTSGLTAAGFLLLVVTALLLILKIERSFNRIWRVSDPRPLGSRLVMFWAVLTLTPLLMGAGLALTAMPVFNQVGLGNEAPGWVRTAGVFLFTLLGLSLAFFLVPNRRVNWRHALIGGLLSTLLFQLAKAGFVGYVKTASYNTLYQSLATVPIFLLWLYVSWMVVLLGASLAAALTTFSYRRAPWRWKKRQELQLIMRIIGHLWTGQRRGQGYTTEDLLLREEAASDSQLQRLLADLLGMDVVHRDETGHWYLARDLDDLCFGDLLKVGHHVLPLEQIDDLPCENHWDRAFILALQSIRNGASVSLDTPLKGLYLFEPPRN